MAASPAIQRSIYTPSIQSYRQIRTTLCLISADLFALVLSVAITLALREASSGIADWRPYLRLWPFLFVFIAAYAVAGLYSGVGLSPPQELRRATLSSALIYMFLAATTLSLRGGTRYFTWTLVLAVGLSVIAVPVLRGLARSRFEMRPWWGAPAVIFGAGTAGREVVKTLLNQPGLGLKPVVVVDDDPESPLSVYGVPVISGGALARDFPQHRRRAYAVVAMPDVPDSQCLSMIEKYGLHFSRVLVIPSFSNFGSLWVDTKNVGGMLGLEVCQQAFERGRHWPKDALDVALTLLGAAVVLPMVALIALWVKIDSPGPVFYAQSRIGQDGKEFQAWKFRTMVGNADQILARYLEENPSLREEWGRTYKLQNDPPITRLGRFLRRTSLDELPQLWNVLQGEMSLVGPRPIVKDEIPKYGKTFELYTKVKSGLTGLWQVSGRNDTSYEERVRLDTFYVRNWSVWLDFYILFRTIETVLFRKGAY
jgi:Undecaprenyl-phosphate galactose phosphotransferase WbaP